MKLALGSAFEDAPFKGGIAIGPQTVDVAAFLWQQHISRAHPLACSGIVDDLSKLATYLSVTGRNPRKSDLVLVHGMPNNSFHHLCCCRDHPMHRLVSSEAADSLRPVPH